MTGNLNGTQDIYNSSLIFLAPRTTPFTAAGKFVHGQPSARFRVVAADTILLATNFDAGGLMILFASVVELIALRHGWIGLSERTP